MSGRKGSKSKLIVIIVLLLALGGFGLFQWRASRERARGRQVVLSIVRAAIDQYTLDNQVEPRSWADLSRGGYIKEVPFDPVTEREMEWNIAVPDQVNWKTVEVVSSDWNARGSIRFILEIPEGWEHPGAFTRLRVQVPDEREFVLDDNLGMVPYTQETEFLSAELRQESKQRVKSDNLLMVPLSQGRTALVLIGHGYASSPGRLHVIELGAKGGPREVLSSDELGLTEALDVNGDGIRELVTTPCMGEAFGNNLETYHPFQVYRLGEAAGTVAQYSLELSKEYNVKHGDGWAGPSCSNDFAVVKLPGKKALLLPLDEAKKLDQASPK